MAFPFDSINRDDVDEDSKLCFVLMPFDEQYEEIYRQVVQPAVESFGITCIRADDIYSTNPIMEDVITSILTAKLIIADLTGKNPNVFYELGIAHSKKQNVILLTQDIQDVPFDLKAMRITVYKQTIAGAEELKLGLRRTIQYFVEEKHVPSQADQLAAVTREFVTKKTLEQANVVGQYGDDSRIDKERQELSTDLLSTMFATLASKYGLDAVELNEEEKRLTFPDGYYVVSSGVIESHSEGGDEQLECDVESTLHISTDEETLAAILIEYAREFRGVRVQYSTQFNIKQLFEESRANEVKIDRLLPNELVFNIGKATLRVANENETGIIEAMAVNGASLSSPMKLSSQLLQAVVQGKLHKEKAGEELGAGWG